MFATPRCLLRKGKTREVKLTIYPEQCLEVVRIREKGKTNHVSVKQAMH